MAQFSFTLSGAADPDTVREAWESAVRTIRDDMDDQVTPLNGTLTVEDQVYVPDDVADAADTDDATPTTSEETEP